MLHQFMLTFNHSLRRVLLPLITILFFIFGAALNTQAQTVDFTLNGGAGPIQGCGPINVAFVASVAGLPPGTAIVSYEWDLGNGNTPSGSSVAGFYNSPGNYTVVLTVTFNNGADYTRVETKVNIITVTSPTASFVATSATSGCNPLNVSFDASASSAVLGSNIISYTWDFDGAGVVTAIPTVSHNFNIAGTYDVSLIVTDDNGCSSSIEIVDMVLITDPFNVNFVADQTQACNQDLPVQFTSNVAPVTSGPFVYAWNFGDASPISTATNPSHTFVYGGVTENFNVTLTVTNPNSGCETIRTINSLITLRNLTVDFTISTGTACSGVAINFNDNSSTNPVGAVYNWDFDGNGSTDAVGQNQNFAYATPGIYTATLTMAGGNGCNGTASRVITILQDPTPNVAPLGNISCQSPFLVNLDGSSSTGTIPGISTYSWAISGAAVITTSTGINSTANINFPVDGTYNLALTINNQNGCSSTTVFNSIVVIAPLVPNFSASNLGGCAPHSFNLTDLSTNQALIDTWSWSIADEHGNVVFNSALQNPAGITLTSAGIYDVTLTISSGAACSETLTSAAYIVVGDRPFDLLTGTPFDVEICNGDQVAFLNTAVQILSSATYNYPTEFLWDFNYVFPGSFTSVGTFNPTTATFDANDYNGVTIYDLNSPPDGPRTFDVALQTISNGCTTTVVIYQAIVYPPFVEFTSTTVCDDPNTVTFDIVQPTIWGSVNEIQWDLLYTNTSGTAVHFTTASLTSGAMVSPLSITLTDVNPASIVSASLISYATTGSLITSGAQVSCSYLFSATVVMPATLPTFDFTSDVQAGCSPLSVTFFDANNIPGVTSITWTFGDGSSVITTASTVTHVYGGGIFTPSGIVTINACPIPFTLPTITATGPNADFTRSVAGGCDPLEVDFNDVSTASTGTIVSRFWNFGALSMISTGAILVNTGTTLSTLSTGTFTHFYPTGNHTITLTVVEEIPISSGTTLPIGAIITPASVVTSGTTIVSGAFLVATTNITLSTGILVCSASRSRNVRASDFGVGITTGAITLACDGDVVEIFSTVSGSPVGGITYDWTFTIATGTPIFPTGDPGITSGSTVVGVGGVIDSGSGTVIFSNLQNINDGATNITLGNGTHQILLTATDGLGCIKTSSSTIVVDIGPVLAIDFDGNPKSGNCPPIGVTFNTIVITSGRTPITNYLWDFGDGNTSILPNPLHNYTFAGNFDVSLTVTDQAGCSQTVLKPDFITLSGPLGTFSIVSGQDIGYLDHTVNFSGISSSPLIEPIRFQWDFGDGAVSSLATGTFAVVTSTWTNDVEHTYTSSGVYVARLIVTDQNGCSWSDPNDNQRIIVLPCPTVTTADVEICESDAPQNFTAVVTDGIAAFAAGEPTIGLDDITTAGYPLTLEYAWERDGIDLGDNDLTVTLSTAGIYVLNVNINETVNTTSGTTVVQKCGVSSVVQATVYPNPVTPDMSANYCDQDGFQTVSAFHVSHIFSGTNVMQYDWEITNVALGTSTILLNTGSSMIANFTSLNFETPRSFIYTVTLTNTSQPTACESVASGTVTFYPDPTIALVTGSFCDGDLASIDSEHATHSLTTSGINVMSYSWAVYNASNALLRTTSGSSVLPILESSTNMHTSATFRYEATVTNSSQPTACSITTSTLLTFYAKPIAILSGSDICVQDNPLVLDAFHLTHDITTGANVMQYDWRVFNDRTNALVRIAANNGNTLSDVRIADDFETSGRYRYEVTISNTNHPVDVSCPTSASVIVNFFPDPQISLVSGNICNGALPTISAFTGTHIQTTASINVMSYAWTVFDVGHNFVRNGVGLNFPVFETSASVHVPATFEYQVTVTNTNQPTMCAITTSTFLTFYDSPIAILSASDLCVQDNPLVLDAFHLTHDIVTGTNVMQYDWVVYNDSNAPVRTVNDGGNILSDTRAADDFETPGTYRYEVTISNTTYPVGVNCPTSASIIVNFYPDPVVTLVSGGFCDGDLTTISAFTGTHIQTTASVNVMSYQWRVYDSGHNLIRLGTGTNISVLESSAGMHSPSTFEYEVIVTNTNQPTSCSITTSTFITYYARPAAALAAPDMCVQDNPLILNAFIVSHEDGGVNVMQYDWTVYNDANAVILTATNAGFTFTDTRAADDFETAGTYRYEVTISNTTHPAPVSCPTSASVIVNFFPDPELPSLTSGNFCDGALGTISAFTATHVQTTASINVMSYNWVVYDDGHAFVRGAVGVNVPILENSVDVHTPATFEYEVTITNTNQPTLCAVTTSTFVTFFGNPVANLAAPDVCEQDAPLTLNAAHPTHITSGSNVMQYDWVVYSSASLVISTATTFDGSFTDIVRPPVDFETASTFTYEVTISNTNQVGLVSCPTSASVVVNYFPDPDITLVSGSFCDGVLNTITAFTGTHIQTTASINVMDYQWTVYDDSHAIVRVAVGAVLPILESSADIHNPGVFEYEVTVTNTNQPINCAITTSTILIFYDSPIAILSASDICSADNPAIISAVHPTHISSGSNVMQYDWVVYNSASLVISSATTFNGLLSDTQNPVDFETPSTFTYEVTITPVNQIGAPVTCPTSASIIINFYPSPDVTLVSGTFCDGTLASLNVFTGTHIQTSASINVMSYAWTVYDAAHVVVRTTSGSSILPILESSVDIHNPGVFEYEVTVTNTNQPTQCAVTTSSFITFYDSPIAILSASDICEQNVPLTVSAFDASHISSGSNVMQYDWLVFNSASLVIASATTFDGLFTDAPRTPIDFETPREFTYQVTITNTNQVGTICPTTASILINYYPDPIFTLISGGFCDGSLTQIDVFDATHIQTTASINVMTYNWTVYDNLHNPIRVFSGSSILPIMESAIDIHTPATFEYEVTVTNTNQPTMCAITSSSFITFFGNPIAILSASDICEQNNPLTVSAFDASHITSGSNVMRYDWVVYNAGLIPIASATTFDGLFTDVPRTPIDFETPRPFTYEVTITNTNQVGTICPTTASILINYYPDPIIVLVSGNFCDGTLAGIDAEHVTHTITSSGINAMTYDWTVYDNLHNPIRTFTGSIIPIQEASVDIHTPGVFEYEVTVTNTNQPTMCAITTSTVITFYESPIAVLSATDICVQDNPVLVSALDPSHLTSGTNVMQYAWVVYEGGLPIASATTFDGLFTDIPRTAIDTETPRAITYEVTIINTTQVGVICATSSSILVNIYPDPIITLISGSFCDGDLASIDAEHATHTQTTASINVMSYAWTVYDNAHAVVRVFTGSVIPIQETSGGQGIPATFEYEVTVTNTNQPTMCAITTSTFIIYNADPLVNLTDFEMCVSVGDTLVSAFDATHIQGGGNVMTYSWSSSSGHPFTVVNDTAITFSPPVVLTSGSVDITFEVIVTHQTTLCATSGQIVVTYFPNPLANINDANFCNDDGAQTLNAADPTHTLGGNVMQYDWEIYDATGATLQESFPNSGPIIVLDKFATDPHLPNTHMYQVTITNTAQPTACQTIASATISFFENPVADLGADFARCQIEGDTLISALDASHFFNGSNIMTYAWVSPSGHNFTVVNDTAISVSEQVTNHAPTPMEFEVTITNTLTNCSSVDVWEITYNPDPVVQLPDSLVYCDSQGDTTLNATPQFGNPNDYAYVWSIYNEDTTTLITADSTTATIVLNRFAKDNGDSLVQNTNVYIVEVKNTLTNCSVFDTLGVRFNPTPFADLKGPFIYCDSDSGQVLNAGHVSHTNNMTYEWFVSDDGGLTFTIVSGATLDSLEVFTPSEFKVYQVVVTDTVTGCNNVSQTPVRFNILPEFKITGHNDSIGTCNPMDTLFVEITNNDNFTIEWQGNSIVEIATDSLWAIINPADTALYTVTVTNPNTGCASTRTKSVKFYAPPVVDLGDSMTFCLRDSAFVLTAFDASHTSSIAYQWFRNDTLIVDSTSSTLSVYDVGVNIYKAIVTDTAGNCSAEDSTVITFNREPQISIIGHDSGVGTCQLTDTLTIIGDVNSQTILWTWITSAGDTLTSSANPLVVNAGSKYNLRVTNPATGCFAEDSIEVVVFSPMEVHLGNDTTLCELDSIVLVATDPSHTVQTRYEWFKLDLLNPANNQALGTNDSLTVSFNNNYNPEVYAVIVNDDSLGCSASDTIIVNFERQPAADAGDDAEICFGEIATLTAQISQAQSFSWRLLSNPDSVISTDSVLMLSPDTTTQYILQVDGQNACKVGFDTATITVNPLPTIAINIEDSILICAGEEIELIASGGASYLWSTNDTLASLTVMPFDRTVYTVIGTDSNGCVGYDTVVVDIIGRIDLLDSIITCETDTTVRIGGVVNSPNAIYIWSNGDSTPFINPRTTGLYEVFIKIDSCEFRASTYVEFKRNPVSDMTSDTTMCFEAGADDRFERIDRSIFAKVDSAIAGEEYYYRWTDTLDNVLSRNKELVMSQGGKYLLQITSNFGCFGLDTIEVFEQCEPRIFVGNAFTPNDDGINESFEVFGSHIIKFEMEIYDRWGEIVHIVKADTFEEIQYEDWWNGLYNNVGKEMEAEVYQWTITYYSLSAPYQPINITGRMSLIR